MKSRGSLLRGPFGAFVVASGMSTFGDYLAMIGFSLFAYKATGSGFVTGALLALQFAAGVCAAPVVGRRASGAARRWLLVFSDTGQAAAMVLLGVSASQGFSGFALPVAAIATGIGSTCGRVAIRAAVPAMVGDESRLQANGLLTATRSVALACGFAGAAGIITLGGFQLAFFVNAATFALSAATAAWLPLSFYDASGETVVRTNEVTSRRARRRAAAALWSGALRAAPAFAGLVVIRAADAFGSASHNVGLPVQFSIEHGNAASTYLGFFWSAWAAGAFGCTALVSRAARGRERDPGLIAFAVGSAAMSISFVFAFASVPFAALIAIGVAAGAADGFTDLAYTTALQAAPDDQRGRVFALSALAEQGGVGLGMAVTAVAIGALGPFATAAMLHGLAVCLSVLFVVSRSAIGRKAVAHLGPPAG